MAYANVAVLYDETGALLPMRDWPPDVARSVAGVKSTKKNLVAGDGIQEDVVEVKLWDKLKALELIGTYLKMFAKQVDIEVKVDVVGILHKGRERARERAIAEGRVIDVVAE